MILQSGAFGTIIVDPECERRVIKTTENEGDCYQEAKMLKLICHANVIKLLHYKEEEATLKFWFRRYDTDLYDIVNDGVLKTTLEKKYLAWQLCRGVAAIHEALVIHRDIKPENCFVDLTSRQLVIGDFGWATLFVPNRSYTLIPGTPGFKPPECVISGDRKYTEKFDVFGVGCTLYYLFSGKQLFLEGTKREMESFFEKGVNNDEGVFEEERIFRGYAWLMRRNPMVRISASLAMSYFT